MAYSEGLLQKIKDAQIILDEMIESAIKQKVLNFQMLYTLRDALNELKVKIETRQELNDFIKKWNEKIIWWVSRTFEGSDLLDLINSIDKEIMKA